MPSPEESGTFTPGRIFGGQLCSQVPVEGVCAGDYIVFVLHGTRTRRVKSVHHGRKHHYVQFEPCKYNAFKKQRINIRDIKSVWRIQGELVLWKEPEEEVSGP